MNRRTPAPAALVCGAVLSLAGTGALPAGPDTAAPWRPLFDGKTLSGWHGFKKELPRAAWRVDGGCLATVREDGSHGGADIVSADSFTDFELRFTWRIAPGGNSGVKYLVTEERPGPIAHEYQVVDDPANPDAQRGPKRTAGAFYDVLPPREDKVSRPAGELNDSRIVVRGPHVEHWLNGAKALEYELGSEALRAAVADSKFKDVAGFGRKISGPILLQHHGDAVWFCSVEVRELSAPEVTRAPGP